MTAWAPRPDSVVYDPQRGRDGVLLGRASDGAWRLVGPAGERWTSEQIEPPARRPLDEFGYEMPHPLRPWDRPDPGWQQNVQFTHATTPWES